VRVERNVGKRVLVTGKKSATVEPVNLQYTSAVHTLLSMDMIQSSSIFSEKVIILSMKEKIPEKSSLLIAMPGHVMEEG